MSGNKGLDPRDPSEEADASGPAREISVDNSVEALEIVFEELESFCRDARLPDTTRRALLLVVEELFVNTVNYGYDETTKDRIVISLQRRADDIRVVLRDHARPFDPTAQQGLAGTDAELADKPVGGLGVFLVGQFTRSFTARRDGDANLVELTLAIDAG